MVTLRIIAIALVVITFAHSGFAPTDEEYETNCMNLFSTIEFFFEREHEELNLDRCFQSYTLEIIVDTYVKYRMTTEIKMKLNLTVDYYNYIFEHNTLNLSNTENPGVFCHEKAKQKYCTLDARLKGDNTSYLDLAERCKDILKSIGISDFDNETQKDAFQLMYFTITSGNLDYKGLTGISPDDDSVDQEIENMKLQGITDTINHDQGTNMKRKITLHPVFETKEEERKKLNYHTKQERRDIDIYIKMFLHSYFTVFVIIITEHIEKSGSFTKVSSYCSDRGIEILQNAEKETAMLSGLSTDDNSKPE